MLLGRGKLNFGDTSSTFDTLLHPFTCGFIRGREMSFSSVSMRSGDFRLRFFVLLETLIAVETSIAVTAVFQSGFGTYPWRSAEMTHEFADMLILLIITCNGRFAVLLSSHFSQNIKRTLHTQIAEIICTQKGSGRSHGTEKRRLILLTKL